MLPLILATLLSPVGPVRDLGADDFAVRQRAVKSVRVSGSRAIPVLLVAERTGDLHTRRTASRLLDPYRTRIQRLLLWCHLASITSQYVTEGGDEERAFYASPLGARYGMLQVALDAGLVKQSDVDADPENRTALQWWGAIPNWVWAVRMQWHNPDWYYRDMAR